MASDKPISRRNFVKGAAIGAIVAGVGAGIGGYYGGLLNTSKKTTTTTETTTVTQTASGGTSPTVSGEAIVIGNSNDLSGPQAGLGTQTNWAYQYAVNQINAEGGVYVNELKRALPVKYIQYDDKSDPTTSQANYQKLATQDKANFLIGGGGAATQADITVAQENNLLFIGGSVDTPAMWAAGYTNLFTVFQQSDQAILPLYEWAQSQPAGNRPTSIAFWDMDSNEGNAFTTNGVAQASKYGFDVVLNQKYEAGATDYTSMIEATESANPDVVAGFPLPPDYATMVQNMITLKYSPKLMFMNRGPMVQPIDESLGATISNTLMPLIWNTDLGTYNDITTAFEAQYKTPPTWLQPGSALVTDILFQAIGIAGALDTNSVKTALQNDMFYTGFGPVKFNQNGSFYPSQLMAQIKYSSTPDSLGNHISWPTVWPSTIANSQLVYPAA